MSLTIFSNFRIDSQERLSRMKDSFSSFDRASIDKWIINARGPLGNEALEFLRKNVGDKLIEYNIESNKGWFHDTQSMIVAIETDYLLYWIEDQICLCGADRLNDVVSEMKLLDADYMGYSWFGLGTFAAEFEGLSQKSLNCMSVVDYDKQAHKIRLQNSLKVIGTKSAIISLAGIFSKTLFTRLVQDRKFFLRRWPKETPFDFERLWNDTSVLPLKYGVPKFEIFCTIDDDNHVPGSSLVSRGLYSERLSREDLLEIRDSAQRKKTFPILRKIFRRNILAHRVYRLLIRISYHF